MAGKRMPEKTKLKEKFVSGEEIEIKEHRAMVYLPENSIAVRIIATIYEDDEVHDVQKDMNLEDLRDAFRKADDGYIDDDDRFVLTEEGVAYLEEMAKGRAT